jgi:hypothetical protein
MLSLELAALLFGVAMMVRGHHGRHTDEEKWTACKAYWRAKGVLEASGQQDDETKVLNLAADYFMDGSDGGWSIRAVREFIQRWANRTQPPHFSDRQRGHAQEVMSDEECRLCIEELRKGYVVNGKHWYYSSLRHASQHPDLCPTVAACRMRYSENRDYSMFRRLQQFDPQLIHIKPKTKHPLTPEVMQQRCETSAWYLQQDPEYFERVFFIDQKVFLMHPETGLVIGYGEDKNEYVAETDDITFYNIATRRSELVRVEVYGMVNYHGGLCGWHVCHGTTGDNRVYLMRHSLSL